MKELTEKELGLKPDLKYYACENGEIYSDFSEKFLDGYVDKNGYKRVYICGKRFLVHRLIAKAFIPNPDSLPVVNHKDTNTLNNQVENLEWTTVRDNIIYSPTYQKRVENIPKGETCHFSVLTEKDVLEIMALLDEGMSCNQIASMYNVVPKSIRNIKNGNTWRSVTGFTKKGSTVIRGDGEAIK